MKLDTNFLSSNSMFAWCEAGPMLDPEKAKVKVLSGEMFGDPTKVRLNLALPKSTIEEAVKRLNSV
jgi:bifunctional pyridoxal-dependent enzyme with beta-cystathionase and maltose regulon repressor activities